MAGFDSGSAEVTSSRICDDESSLAAVGYLNGRPGFRAIGGSLRKYREYFQNWYFLGQNASIILEAAQSMRFTVMTGASGHGI
jgi:hypothetical protein